MSASVGLQHTAQGATVRIATPDDDSFKLTVFINRGVLFDGFPSFEIKAQFRDCPYCLIPAGTLNFCGMCGREVLWGDSPTDKLLEEEKE